MRSTLLIFIEMRSTLLILTCLATRCAASLPASYPQVLSQTLKVRGGARLSPDARAFFVIEQILKRVAGQEAELDFNVTKVRELPESEILRVLTLAAVGNFTSSKADDFQRQVSVVVDPDGKGFDVEWQAGDSALAVEVMLIILCLVHFKKWAQEQLA